MKKTWIISLLVGIIALSYSCDNSVDLTAEYRDIPVVYGVLSRADSIHYIKIEKAFLGASGENALDIAQIPDSIYYDNLDVKIERLSTGELFSLEMVDGNLEGLEREDGVFANAPNYLYKIILSEEDKLVGGEEYILRVNRGDGKEEIRASTTIVNDFTFVLPSIPTEINIRYRAYRMDWRKFDDASFYDVKIMFHYIEKAPGASTFEDKSVLWEVENNVSAEGSSSSLFSYELDGENMFRFFGNELDDEDGYERFIVSFDFIIDAGGQEIADYINIGQANTGITSSQVIPTYTNLSEGFGVFSSKNRIIHPGFSFKSETRDSLANGIYTSKLGFQF